MCGRFSFHTIERLKKIMRILEVEPPANLSVNIPPFTDIYALYNNNENILSARNMYWQLIPDFCKEFKSQYKMFNTRAETLFEKKFKRDLIISRRCLIPVDCYYEWKKEGKKKIPYLFKLADKEIMFLGGIYSVWENPYNGIPGYSCSIITTDAASHVKHIHSRMPLIIDESKTGQWLDKTFMVSSEISTMIKPYKGQGLKYKKTSLP